MQIEKIGKGCRWHSVIAFGEFQEIKRTNRKIEILREFNDKFEHLTPVEAMIKEQWNIGGIVVFRINVRRITGVAES